MKIKQLKQVYKMQKQLETKAGWFMIMDSNAPKNNKVFIFRVLC